MKKYFVVSDVHGFYTQMKSALDEVGFDKDNPDHIFVSCGDLLDRGSQPVDCLRFVNSIPSDQKILICGNHETLMDAMLNRMDALSYDFSNGTFQTVVDSYYDKTIIHGKGIDYFTWFKKWKQWKDYRKSCVDFYETPKYVFVHGWIPCKSDDPNPYHARKINYSSIEDWRNGNWEYARWINGMEAWYQGVRVEGKMVVCGHWHTSYGHSKLHSDGVEFPNKYSTNPEHRYANFDPFVDNGIIALDGCTALTHKVNCVVLEDN